MSDHKKSTLGLNPAKHLDGGGHFTLPEKYSYMSGMRHDAVITELCEIIEKLQDRIEELERWLPVPPDEEEDF